MFTFTFYQTEDEKAFNLAVTNWYYSCGDPEQKAHIMAFFDCTEERLWEEMRRVIRTEHDKGEEYYRSGKYDQDQLKEAKEQLELAKKMSSKHKQVMIDYWQNRVSEYAQKLFKRVYGKKQSAPTGVKIR